MYVSSDLECRTITGSQQLESSITQMYFNGSVETPCVPKELGTLQKELGTIANRTAQRDPEAKPYNLDFRITGQREVKQSLGMANRSWGRMLT